MRNIKGPKNDTEDVSTLVTDTGYHVPLTQLKLMDKQTLCKAVHEYYTLIKVLPQINQFGEGLDSLGMLSMMRQYCNHILLTGKKPVNKGN